MRTRGRQFSRGDTIVEMIFAFSILSLVVVGVMMIMNRGISISQNSIEYTLVRQQMDGQAEMVRFIHDTNPAAWAKIKERTTDAIMPLSTIPCPTISTLASGSNPAGFKTSFMIRQTAPGVFSVVSIDSTTYTDPSSYAKIDYATGRSYGMWLQIAKAENNAAPTSQASALVAYDVYVHACWYGSGSTTPTTLGTIVRLYDR